MIGWATASGASLTSFSITGTTMIITGTVDEPHRLVSEPNARCVRCHRVLDHQRSSTPTYAAFTTPVAAIRLTMNALSSAGGKVTATIQQAGIG
jgi:hypothetical protein